MDNPRSPWSRCIQLSALSVTVQQAYSLLWHPLRQRVGCVQHRSTSEANRIGPDHQDCWYSPSLPCNGPLAHPFEQILPVRQPTRRPEQADIGWISRSLVPREWNLGLAQTFYSVMWLTTSSALEYRHADRTPAFRACHRNGCANGYH